MSRRKTVIRCWRRKIAMESYDELVKRAQSLLPHKGEEKNRFEIPSVKGRVQGKKTVIINLKAIADFVDRDEDFLFSYLMRELATKGIKEGNYHVFMGNFAAIKINEKVLSFVKEYVNCRECGKPDTKMSKTDRIMFIKCMACGAKYPIRK
jgi:translation initiation factor 2 subunit 2